MACVVLIAAQTRFLGQEFADAYACSSIVLPPSRNPPEQMESRRVTVEERPPLAEHRSRRLTAGHSRSVCKQ
ncbi:MAG TPA: hypothetical protein VFW38_00580 [Solirubrobacteraceae bacterium]|nr:hypothetical protein [Solirubrobacteraceae bacterium]